MCVGYPKNLSWSNDSWTQITIKENLPQIKEYIVVPHEGKYQFISVQRLGSSEQIYVGIK